MIAEINYSGHSSLVQMRLIINGLSIPVRQMGPDFVLVDSSADVPPGDATIALSVDGKERRWRVRLPEGVSKESDRVTLALSE
jgi:hypothetical protein